MCVDGPCPLAQELRVQHPVTVAFPTGAENRTPPTKVYVVAAAAKTRKHDRREDVMRNDSCPRHVPKEWESFSEGPREVEQAQVVPSESATPSLELPTSGAISQGQAACLKLLVQKKGSSPQRNSSCLTTSTQMARLNGSMLFLDSLVCTICLSLIIGFHKGVRPNSCLQVLFRRGSCCVFIVQLRLRRLCQSLLLGDSDCEILDTWFC